MKKKWKIKQPDEALKKKLSKSLHISPLISAVLINRNIKTEEEARRFLESDLSGLITPFKMKGIREAVSRLKKAFKNKEKILIYGDYDADGITALTLLYIVFEKFTPNLTYYIPNRLEEGYGLNRQACEVAKSRGVSLVVTVDCGVTAVDEVAYLKAQGIDTIITDHHEVKDSLPEALSIIDPHRKDCQYPFKELAGVGVAFKLAQALLTDLMDNPLMYLKPHLDLVALGTISDVVPLLNENRIFVKYGLKQLNQTEKLGLKALIKTSRLNNKTISTNHIGFILGPRINAAGRLGDACAPLRLLLAKDAEEAEALAKLLNDGNRDRQKIQKRTLKQALSLIEKEINFKDHKVIILDDDWHPGVMGIVASKIVDKYYRPTILISTREDIAKGSGRSIDNFHLFDAVKKCSALLDAFGGHKKACGITILKDKIALFKDRINEIAHNVLSVEDLFPKLEIDSEVSLDEIDLNLIKELDKLSPFGTGNPKPIFASSGLSLKASPKFLKKNGTKLLVTNGGFTHEAVGFSIDGVNFNNLQGRRISLAHTPTLNNFQGRDYITLAIKDIKTED
jgi:single-stranded-DNA-specific exonuclease